MLRYLRLLFPLAPRDRLVLRALRALRDLLVQLALQVPLDLPAPQVLPDLLALLAPLDPLADLDLPDLPDLLV